MTTREVLDNKIREIEKDYTRFFSNYSYGTNDEVCVVFLGFRRRISNKNILLSFSLLEKYTHLDWKNI